MSAIEHAAAMSRLDREKLIARLTGSINPLDARCGECGAKPGKRCYGNGEMRRPHPSREMKAERELRVEAADALAAQPVLDPDSDERVIAWERVADHPALKPCYAEERPLLFAVLDRLTSLFELERAVTELAPAPVIVLDPEKVAALIDREFDDYRPVYSKEGKCINSNAARALCEAAKRGELS